MNLPSGWEHFDAMLAGRGLSLDEQMGSALIYTDGAGRRLRRRAPLVFEVADGLRRSGLPMSRTGLAGRVASTGLYGLAILLFLATAYILIKLSRSPDSDWVVGAATAAPTALLGILAAALARSGDRR